MTHAELLEEVSAFVACCFYDLHDEPTPMDIEEATWTMENWRQDNVEYPEEMTAEMLVDVWNKEVYNFNHKTKEDTHMKNISIDNGRSYCTPSDAIAEASWDAIVAMMDDETCETVHRELAPCSNEEFLVRYLELAPEDLIVG